MTLKPNKGKGFESVKHLSISNEIENIAYKKSITYQYEDPGF
jgi:hypothetical protein